MTDVIAGIKREALLKEISAAIRQWSELERRIFSQAHYQGQSIEAISCSLQLDVEQVNTILKQCDRRLYAFLRSFRKNSRENSSLATTGVSCLASCQQDLSEIQVLAS
jgi:DNA-directed RNA polymerase specialized sigma24 family protein